MSKSDLKDLTLDELIQFVTQMGEKPYRAKQLYPWLYRKRVKSFSEMTDLSAAFRERLEQQSEISSLEAVLRQVSTDGTRKYLFQLQDGQTIESVMIPDDDRLTICISTQVGCAMGCVFCLTGTMGQIRNLQPSEIVNQVLAVEQDLHDEPPKDIEGNPVEPQQSGPIKRYLTNIVMMGMGEPMLNLDNVIKTIRILTSSEGFNLAPRRITVSTVGLVPQIEKLGLANTNVNLAISLTAPTDEKRSKLLPVNKKYNLDKLMQTLRAYPLAPRRRITFEYVMLQGINDTEEDAYHLVRLLKGLQCKINLIPLNEIPNFIYKRPEMETIVQFQKILWDAGMTATIRESRGRDISAACGQLRTTEEHVSGL
jgi:23S rRNA (adenine2503-C2)-methyltransferase